MEKLLTTKDLALAIGVSESSLRRCTDSGAINTSRTPGGHRRIPLSEAIRFIRLTHATVLHPDVLGLPDVAPAAQASRPDEAAEQFHAALVAGDASRARGHIVAMYLNGMSVAAICDGPIRLAMGRVGDLWQHDCQGILVEHRATDICIGAVSAIRQLLPEPADAAPLAIGGAPPDDPYVVPSAAAAAVIADAGWRESNFGPRVPLELLADAARDRKAGLVWLSISFVSEAPTLQKAMRKLAGQLERLHVPLVIGGRCAGDLGAPRLANVHLMQSMTELSAFARGAARAKS